MNQRESRDRSGESIELWGMHFPESLAEAARDYHNSISEFEPTRQRVTSCLQKCVEDFQSQGEPKITPKVGEEPSEIARKMVQGSPLGRQIREKLGCEEKRLRLNEEQKSFWKDLSVKQREALAERFDEVEQITESKLGEEYIGVIIPGADWALKPKELKRTQAKHVLDRAVELIGKGFSASELEKPVQK